MAAHCLELFFNMQSQRRTAKVGHPLLSFQESLAWVEGLLSPYATPPMVALSRPQGAGNRAPKSDFRSFLTRSVHFSQIDIGLVSFSVGHTMPKLHSETIKF